MGMEFVNKLREKPAVQKIEKFFPAIAFLGGFAWDSITLGQMVYGSDILILLAYYTGALILVILLSAQLEHPEGWTKERLQALAKAQQKPAPTQKQAASPAKPVEQPAKPEEPVVENSVTEEPVAEPEEEPLVKLSPRKHRPAPRKPLTAPLLKLKKRRLRPQPLRLLRPRRPPLKQLPRLLPKRKTPLSRQKGPPPSWPRMWVTNRPRFLKMRLLYATVSWTVNGAKPGNNALLGQFSSSSAACSVP